MMTLIDAAWDRLPEDDNKILPTWPSVLRSCVAEILQGMGNAIEKQTC